MRVSVTWLWEDYLHFSDAVSAVLRYRSEVPVLRASEPDGPAVSPDFYVYEDGEADWDAADVNAAYEPSEHTVLKTKFTELQDACCLDDVAVYLFMIDVVYLGLEPVTALIAGGDSSIDLCRRTVEVSELELKYDRVVAQLTSVTPDCETLRSLV